VVPREDSVRAGELELRTEEGRDFPPYDTGFGRCVTGMYMYMDIQISKSGRINDFGMGLFINPKKKYHCFIPF
jgi:hypothetical protein